MSEQTPNPESTSPPNPVPPTSGDRREQRRAERDARREARRQTTSGHHYGWVGGAILVLLGISFLLPNLGYPILTNWWALIILIPAFGSYVAAWNIYHTNGRMTQGAAGSLTVGVLLTVLTLIFLLNLAFGVLWPILLIVGGLLLLISAFFPR